MSDFLRVDHRTASELAEIVELAVADEAAFARRRHSPTLAGRRIALWWDGPGFRNRVAFQLGVGLLGGVAVEVPGPVDGGEDLADRAGYLGNWFDAIVVRTPQLSSLQRLADATPALVVNARTSHNHPCEIVGDLAFLHAAGRPLGEPLHVAFVGAATNLCHSWLEAATVLPLTITQVCPPGFEADADRWYRESPDRAGSLTVGVPLGEALASADVVYTDAWPADLSPDDERAFAGLQITGDHLDRCPPGASFLPCPPVTRNREVDATAMAHPSCRVVEAKRWLLHAQNALLVAGLAGGPSGLPPGG